MGRNRTADERWLRSPMVSTIMTGSNVDFNSGVIRNVCAAEECTAKSYDEDLDNRTLQMFTELSNGIRLGPHVNIGHGGMSDDSIGRRMGRAVGFNVVDSRIIVDEIRFDRAALEDPRQQAQSLMRRAQDDPDSFGLSFVFSGESEVILEEDGTRSKDEDGNNLNKLVRPKKVMSLDFVGKPAATDNLFSVKGLEGSNAMLSSGFTEMLDRLVDSPDFADRVQSFLRKYSNNRDNDSHKEQQKQQEIAVMDEKTKFEAFKKLFGAKDSNKVEDMPSNESNINFMERAAIVEVGKFVKDRLSSQGLTPGQLNTEGLSGVLSMHLCQAVCADKSQSDEELVKECPSMYALAASLDWDDAKVVAKASDMFKVQDPFGTVLNALGNSPAFLAAESSYSNFARIIEDSKADIPPGGGKTVMSEDGLEDKHKYFSTSSSNVRAAITGVNPKIVDDATYLKYTYGIN